MWSVFWGNVGRGHVRQVVHKVEHLKELPSLPGQVTATDLIKNAVQNEPRNAKRILKLYADQAHKYPEPRPIHHTAPALVKLPLRTSVSALKHFASLLQAVFNPHQQQAFTEQHFLSRLQFLRSKRMELQLLSAGFSHPGQTV